MSRLGAAREPLIGAVIVILLAVIPPAIGGYVVRGLTSYMIFGLLALSVGLITGYGRLFNLGAGANFGVSAYTVAILTHPPFSIFNPFVLFAAAMFTGFLVSLLFSFYALVASGIEYLMLTFLTTAAFAALPLATLDLTGGDNGLRVLGGSAPSFGLNPLIGNSFYWFVLAVVALITLLSWYILTSQSGKAIQAIGRNPSRAAAMGYSVPRFRVALTIYSSLVASLGGWLYALQTSFVFIDLLGISNSTNGLVYALIGGVDTILGPFLGTALLRALTDQLSRVGSQSSLFIGIMLMLVVYLIPEGILGLWRRFARRHFPTQGDRGLEAPEDADTLAAGLTAENVEAL
ncbi:MAG: branched-chain amino acid ABC transporter permease [Chloroflexi bacterium]|nr:branched-chain amino acid ABC transporter permease [Chloroflexota bacterium]